MFWHVALLISAVLGDDNYQNAELRIPDFVTRNHASLPAKGTIKFSSMPRRFGLLNSSIAEVRRNVQDLNGSFRSLTTYAPVVAHAINFAFYRANNTTMFGVVPNARVSEVVLEPGSSEIQITGHIERELHVTERAVLSTLAQFFAIFQLDSFISMASSLILKLDHNSQRKLVRDMSSFFNIISHKLNTGASENKNQLLIGPRIASACAVSEERPFCFYHHSDSYTSREPPFLRLVQQANKRKVNFKTDTVTSAFLESPYVTAINRRIGVIDRVVFDSIVTWVHHDFCYFMMRIAAPLSHYFSRLEPTYKRQLFDAVIVYNKRQGSKSNPDAKERIATCLAESDAFDSLDKAFGDKKYKLELLHFLSEPPALFTFLALEADSIIPKVASSLMRDATNQFNRLIDLVYNFDNVRSRQPSIYTDAINQLALGNKFLSDLVPVDLAELEQAIRRLRIAR